MDDEVSITVGQADTRSGYERVLAFIREQLLNGTLKIGDRLLAERALAQELGVSRPVIREVLRALAAIGVIDIRHGHGSIVREPDMSEMSDFFTLMLAQRANVVEDVMEARIAIERHAIRLACERATTADFAELDAALRHIAATIRDPMIGGEADFRFHAHLVNAAHSPTLTSLYTAISHLLQRSHMQRRRRISEVPGIESFLIDHHRAVLAALVDADPDKADKVLAQHFEIGTNYQRLAMRLALEQHD